MSQQSLRKVRSLTREMGMCAFKCHKRKVCSSLFSLCGKFPAATGSSMLVYGLADKVASETAEHPGRPHLTLPRI